ncbi:pumilio homolog 1-like isoform X2 [Typha latifolia]|uniref:pumilio homolog 1-like isoform X2 n=1 Tax=Typha latifolia TaxID=4733 RepID=UPI003C30C8E0
MGSVAPGDFGDVEKDIEKLLTEQNHGKATAAFERSGSAPPTVEGSRATNKSFFDIDGGERPLPEKEMRLHSGNLSNNHYTNDDVNSRFLWPTVSSKEDLVAVQRLPPGVVGELRRNGLGGCASSGAQRMMSQQSSSDWLHQGSDGLIGSKARRKSYADLLKEDSGNSASFSTYYTQSRSSNKFNCVIDPNGVPNRLNGQEDIDHQQSGVTSPSLLRTQSFHSMSNPLASVDGSSLTNSKFSDPTQMRQFPSPCITPSLGKAANVDREALAKGFQGTSFYTPDYTDISAVLSGLNLSNGMVMDGSIPMSNNKLHSGATFFGSTVGQYYNRMGNQLGSDLQVPVLATLYPLSFKEDSGAPVQAVPSMNSSPLVNNCINAASVGLPTVPRGWEPYLEALILQQKAQQNELFSCKFGLASQRLYPGSISGFPHLGFKTTGSVCCSLGLGNPLGQSDQQSHFPYLRGIANSRSMELWNHKNSLLRDSFEVSLLDELKNSKSQSLELIDIVDHVIKFSTDQYGSRFIQQKLETASVDEKNKIFPKIVTHALALTTDVFGNYVIQKFFELGTVNQRNQLTSQLLGHVLHLSLQMYGCRVIQKAMEVVDVDQRIQLASELDGSIIKCIRDQNGNHVIQKCIELIPEDKIQFIISSVYGQVLMLSTHPYGCRVIQRVLEHCKNPKTQSTVMDEIMQSMCTLTQDQYGNYVIQYVLQHGKQEERSAIIYRLAGQIVMMSQQKFASNVVEKCLTYGTPEERQLLIKEMIDSTDGNEPLQAMMKDRFANYVVQKALEICDDENREIILSRIKVHMKELKDFTYGKHIVTRFEKLFAAGGNMN